MVNSVVICLSKAHARLRREVERFERQQAKHEKGRGVACFQKLGWGVVIYALAFVQCKISV